MPATPSERLARFWNRRAGDYDRRMARVERARLADSRSWVCARAHGDVLLACVGTGQDLPLLPREATVVGIDLSERMVELATARARELGREARILVGDVMALPFDDASFDAVVCTYALCSVPDPARALREFRRVLRAGGRLLLADHIGSSNPIVRLGQHALELVTIPLEGEHYTRRPSTLLAAAGLETVEIERHSAGIIEHLEARPV